ncbi:hypothetical protein IQ13_0898 [Lacibacter cauensis]|uniref:LTXXQ motif family protein n=1 Tax=Lacibacter cauensis TaxID=510947 RepID=A0A562SX38_9BACT|nr:hypothetical protein [Lacibacter cauensis]TWI85733.1 hypothetical protein IQ13_0898 [Lacibacter cauensis]
MIKKILISCFSILLLLVAAAKGQGTSKLSAECIEQLRLSSEIVAKTESILNTYSQKMRAVMIDRNTKGAARKQKMDQLLVEREQALRAFLSQEQVSILFSAQRERVRKKMEEVRKNGGPKNKN